MTKIGQKMTEIIHFDDLIKNVPLEKTLMKFLNLLIQMAPIQAPGAPKSSKGILR